ncbi:MAG: hypothetical protein Q9221_008770, partial [Calogaya cf. arnoldii]
HPKWPTDKEWSKLNNTVSGRLIRSVPLVHRAPLYGALSDGGEGNYAVVFSLTTKAHSYGPTAGASIVFANTDNNKYWTAIGAFHKRLLYLNTIPGFATFWGLDNQAFALSVATLRGGGQSKMTTAWDSFIKELQDLGVSLISYHTTVHQTFYDHYQHYDFPPEIYASNNTIGGRLIPPSTVENKLPNLLNAFPWRDALYTLDVGIGFDADASTSELREAQAKVNSWQALFEPLTPGGGADMNEATFDAPNWKRDNFGVNYDRLLEVKKKYDPNFALWQHASVGADVYWEVASDGRLCRVS